MKKKSRKLKPPRQAQVTGPIHVTYTSDYLGYVAHSLAKEEKGEPVEDYVDYLERIDRDRFRQKRESEKVSTEELMRRIRERDELEKQTRDREPE